MDGKSWLRAEWDRVAGYSLIALGALLLVLGYAGVSDSPYVAEGLSYIMSGGIGGLFMLGAGATLLISADLHDEWRKLDRVEEALRAGEPIPAPVPPAAAKLSETNGSTAEAATGGRAAQPAGAARGTV
ncbi:MAG: hypothetical protein ACRD0O_02430 [Acidimicrobiia bacterium]